MTARPDRGKSGADEDIAIIGLGYVGLPLAVGFVEAGLEVHGIDASEKRVADLRAGRSPVDDVGAERLRAALQVGLRVVHTSEADLSPSDAVFVCVPTPITRAKEPDLSALMDAASSIRSALRPGQLVVLQSTTYPGTTNGPFRGELERSGLSATSDFHLAFAPERVNPGDPASHQRTTPRIVGGATPEAGDRAARLLRRITDTVVVVSSPDVAEMAKILENVFRNVNIALVNQLALLCERMGIDVWEVVDAAATKPFGFMRFTPGPGVGGHCIPVDPYYLAWRAREFDFTDRFVELAGDINLQMPRHVVRLATDALNEHGLALRRSKVGVVGVAFKPNVRDPRNSPAAAIMALLTQQGADVAYHDPHVSEFRDESGRAYASLDLDRLLGRSDIVVVVTPHRAIDWDGLYSRARIVVDTTNSSRGRTVTAGQVLRLGAGWS